MNEMNNHDRYDQIIEGSLARRADVVERPGLEQRLLAVVAEQETASVGWWGPIWKWSFAGVAVVLMLSMAWWVQTPTQTNTQQANLKPPPQTNRSGVIEPSRIFGTPLQPRSLMTTVLQHHPVKGTPGGEPNIASVKKDVFPSPTALSEDERILLSFVRRARPEAIVAAARPDRFYENDKATSSPQYMNQVGPSSDNLDRNTH
jgi:hypothetical protein